jgi:signal recognition particle GTPase
MSNDTQLKQAVLDELAWEPSLNAAHIGVTAKGGVIAGIAHSRAGRPPVPVRFIGVGEGMDDLRPFVADDFVTALLGS